MKVDGLEVDHVGPLPWIQRSTMSMLLQALSIPAKSQHTPHTHPWPQQPSGLHLQTWLAAEPVGESLGFPLGDRQSQVQKAWLIEVSCLLMCLNFQVETSI